MKKLLLYLILVAGLFAPATNINAQDIPSAVTQFSFFNENLNKETVAHVKRVTADGGVVTDKQGLDRYITQIKRLGIKDNTRIVTAPEWGIKKDANGYISKLYNPFYKLSDNLIVNGSFDNTTWWNYGANWTIANGKATHTAGAGASVSRNFMTMGKKYKIIYTVLDYASGSIKVYCGDGAPGITRTSNGTFTEELTCTTNGYLSLSCDAAFAGSVDNVYCYEILNPDLEQSTASNQPQFRSYPALPFSYQIGLNGVDQYASVVPKYINKGVNLVVDGTFEADVIGQCPATWGMNAGTVATVINSDKHSGDKCMQVVQTGVGSATNKMGFGTSSTLSTLKAYTREFWAKSVSGNNQLIIRSANAFFGNSTPYTLTNQWQKFTYSAVPTGSTPDMMVYLVDSGTFLIDDISIVESIGSLDFNDNEQIVNSGNKDFETATDFTSLGNHSAARSTEDKHAGTNSLKVTSTGTGDAAANYTYLASSKFDTVKAGKKYTLEAYARGTGILGSEKVTNGTDWIDSNTDGLADGWELGNATGGIVTGNGFTGNAQRVVWNGSNAYDQISLNILTTGKTYSLAFKYRANKQLNIWVNGTDKSFVANTGNAALVSTTIVAGRIQIAFGQASLSTGDWFEIDDISIKEITQPTLTMLIGSKTVSSTVSCVPGSFSKLVLNFQATASEVNQPIKFYSSQADAVYVDDVSLTEYHPYTFSGWFKTGLSGVDTYIMSKKDDKTPSAGYFIRQGSSNKIQFIVFDGYTSTGIASTNSFNDNKWHYYVVIHDAAAPSNGSKLYIDNVLEAQGNFNLGVSNTPFALTIGRHTYLSSYYFLGSLGPQRIIRDYTYTLSDVQNEYASGLLFTPPSGQVVAQYDWTDFKDRSAIGNDLTNNGNIQTSTTTADKRGLIYFDGSNDFMKTPLITLNQPTTVYAGIRQNVWGDARYIFDAYAFNSTAAMGLYQRGSAPNLRIASNSNSIDNNNLPVNIFGYTKTIFNGTNSLIQINNGTSSTGTLGTTSSNGFTMGSRSDLTNYGSFETGPIIILDVVPTPAQDAWIKSYLFNKWGIR